MEQYVAPFLELLHEEGKSRHTIHAYRHSLHSYLTWFETTFGRMPSKILSQNIRDYISYLETVKKLSGTTINHRLSGLLIWNRYLVEKGIQNEIVITKASRKKIQSPGTSPAKHEKQDIHVFLQTVLESGNTKHYALVIMLAYAGLRISEALCLQMSDIDFIHRRIRVQGKGDRTRFVPLSHRIIKALKSYLEERKQHRFSQSFYLFVSNKGEQMTRHNANKLFEHYSQFAGLEKRLTPHDLRHFFCTLALEKGFQIHEVANMAGHANIQTTLRYTNPSHQQMIEKIDML